MGLSIYKRVIRASALVAVTMTMTIGCGDGKTKKRQPVNKNAKANAQKGNIDPKTGKPVITGNPETDRKNAEAARVLGEKENRFDGMTTQMFAEGESINKGALEEGKYKLTRFTTSVKYLGASQMRGNFTGTPVLDKANFPMFSDVTSEGLGGSANSPDASGRQIEVPMQFEINARPYYFERSQENQLILITTKAVTKMNKGGDFKVEFENVLSGIDAKNLARSTTKASVIDLLRQDGVADPKIGHTYSAKNSPKKIDLRLRKISDTKIRVTIEIAEADVFFRYIILDYDFAKATGVSASSTAAPSRSEGAPAPEASAGQQTASAEVSAAPATGAPTANPPDDDGK